MKQPHEDIIGTQRTDDILSLAPEAAVYRTALVSVTHHLFDALLVGEPAPRVKRMYERLSNPQIGDLVVEVSTIHRADAEGRIKGFGILVDHREEWWQTDEEWEAEVESERASMREIGYPEWEPEERPTDHAWYIQYGPNPEAICRWVNCSFQVIPWELSLFRTEVGTPTETGGVVLTRGDIIGSLADAGFKLRG